MRILAALFISMFLYVAGAWAATINFTDGRVVQGNITKQDDKSVQIDVDGIPMTYYADEIKDVDGKPFGTARPEAAAQPVITTPPPANAGAVVMPLPASPGAGMDEEKKALILKFIDVFGTRQALTNNFDLMIKQIEKEKPDEAQKIRQRVKVDEIIERLLPIYDRNFTSEDLKSFIAFYGSAEGQKLIATIPELMKESVQESVKYMEEKFPEVKQGQQ